MEDYTVQGLEAKVQSLCISNDSNNQHPKQSLVADPVFEHFYDTTTIDEEGVSNFTRVLKFEEPIHLYALLDSEIFLDVVRASEPGRPLSYLSLQDDLMKVQDEIQGGAAAVQEMFDFLEKLSVKHKHFVLTSCALTMVELYHKIILRQYGIIHDPKFLALKEVRSPIYTNCFRNEAPPYAEVRANLDDTIPHLQWILKHAAQDMANIKNSLEFKKFRAKLTTARELHQAKLERSSKAAQRVVDQAVDRAAYEAYSDWIQQLAETKANNDKMHERRVKKNLQIKNINVENLRQLGSQTRTPLPQNVVDALSTIQTSHNDTVFGELLSEEKGKQDPGSQVVDEENLHNAVGYMTLTVQPEDFHEELLQDIEVADGFENIAK